MMKFRHLNIISDVHPGLSLSPRLQKNSRNLSVSGVFWVEDGIRTRDPQNHNLML